MFGPIPTAVLDREAPVAKSPSCTVLCDCDALDELHSHEMTLHASTNPGFTWHPDRTTPATNLQRIRWENHERWLRSRA